MKSVLNRNDKSKQRHIFYMKSNLIFYKHKKHYYSIMNNEKKTYFSSLSRDNLSRLPLNTQNSPHIKTPQTYIHHNHFKNSNSYENHDAVSESTIEVWNCRQKWCHFRIVSLSPGLVVSHAWPINNTGRLASVIFLLTLTLCTCTKIIIFLINYYFIFYSLKFKVDRKLSVFFSIH